MASTKHIVVVGAGAAGLNVAARLRRLAAEFSITIIDPSSVHYYQPLWTFVGGGVFPRERSKRDMVELIPAGARWVKDSAVEFLPEQNMVVTQGGERLTYDALVMAPGIQINWQAVVGLKDTLGKNGVCSNYSYESVDSTWAQVQALHTGRALFTFPSTPIKCAGAPLKVMFLAEDYWRRTGVRKQINVDYMCGVAAIFRAPKYAAELVKIAAARDLATHFKQDLIAVRGDAKEAVFRDTESGAERVEKFNFLHVAPPMGALELMKQSPLADGAGWIEVNKNTLQHPRFPNVFSLGDGSSLPTSKTAAAVRAQGPVLVANLLAALRGAPPRATYNGYTSCPLVTGYGRLILAEFDYDLQPCETFPIDQGRERRSMYWLKKYVMPIIYWQGLVRGRSWPWPIPDPHL